MNKNSFAKVPPMGWNSYDYYDTTVNEEQVKANADYMAAHLKDFGWEYIVVDIQWYAHKAGSMREQFQYIPFSELEIHACCLTRSVSPLLQTERDSALWLNICTAWD